MLYSVAANELEGLTLSPAVSPKVSPVASPYRPRHRRRNSKLLDGAFHRVDPTPPGWDISHKADENSPLISKADTCGAATKVHYRLQAPVVRAELHALSFLATQMLMCGFLEWIPSFVTNVYIGHVDATKSSEFLAARSLSGIFLMLSGFAVNVSLAAAMDTLCAQAAGAGKLHEMGIFFQTGLFLFLVAFVPVTLMSYFCVDILVLLGQRHDISLLARDLVLYTLPSFPFYAVNILLCRILEGQNVIRPLMYAGIASNVVFNSLSYVLMFHTSLGYKGAAVASTALAACFTLTLCTYFVRSPLYKQQWTGWKIKEAIQIMPTFIRLGLSGLLMTLSIFFGFAAIELLAGLLPSPDVAISADAVYVSFRSLCYLFYGAASSATAIRVGNALGANEPHRAKTTALLGVGLTVAVSGTSSIVMFGLRNVYPYAYTSDEAVVSVASSLLALTSPMQIFGGICSAVEGIFRGCGHQILGAKLNVLAFVVTAIPVGYFFGFDMQMGLVGLWIGIFTGFVICACYGMYWVLTVDWEAMAWEAQERTEEAEEEELC